MRKKFRIKKTNTIFLIVFLLLAVVIFIPRDKLKIKLKNDKINYSKNLSTSLKITYKDKDVTKETKIFYDDLKLGKNKITFVYSKDSKKIKKTKTIKLYDTEAPTIELKGDKIINLLLGAKYEEPGFEYHDNYDQKLNIEVINNIDTSIEGNYEVKYVSTDSSGNKTTEKRVVSVSNATPLTAEVKDFSLNGFYSNVQLKFNNNNKDYADDFIIAGDSTALNYVLNKVVSSKKLWHKE